MAANSKFHFECRECGHEIDGFKEWFEHGQKCSKCGKSNVYSIYHTDENKLKELIEFKGKPDSLWHYFDFLPLNDKKNIVTLGEGVSPIQEWEFLEKYAKAKYNLDVKVFVNRNDFSPGTGTFKDKGGTLIASVLKEHGIKEYVVASTGNTANAVAQYCAKAGISASIFVPQDALAENFVHIGALGQKVYFVKGDYAYAKKIAGEYAKKHGILISLGNLDPLRLEAKKTTAFEIMRQMGKMPDIYIQAVSGGTAPLGLEKAFADFSKSGILGKMPRMFFVQGHYCAPQVHAWNKAKANNFPEGWEKEYPIYDNPKVYVPTIATGNPGLYPQLAKLVKKSEGEYFEVIEETSIDVARLVAFETSAKLGPASAIAILGFFEALKQNTIKNGESIFINTGEGVGRAISFLEDVSYTLEKISSVEETSRFDREQYRDFVWKPFMEY